MSRHISRSGSMSLVFNPRVALVLERRSEGGRPDAWITSDLYYRFVASATRVYESLSSEGLFHRDGGSLFLDHNRASRCSVSMSLFRNNLLISPTVVQNREGEQRRGIAFVVDGGEIGTMDHFEAMAFVEMLDHLDVSTFGLLAGVSDQLDAIDRKLDSVRTDLGTIIAMLEKGDRRGTAPAPFSWSALPSNPLG